MSVSVSICIRQRSARSDLAAIVLGPLGVHEGVRLDVLVEAEQIGEGALERGVQVGVVRSQVLDCGHALQSLQRENAKAKEEVENHLAKAEISAPEQIRNINVREEIEVGDHVFDPESCDGSKDDLEDMSLAQQVEEEAGAPDAQGNGGGLLERVQAVCEVGRAAVRGVASERERCEVLPGLSFVLIAGGIVLLVGEDKGNDEGVQGSELGHSVELLGHVAWIVVVRVAWVATTAIFDVGAASLLGCNSNRKQSDCTEGKLGHI